MAVSFPSQNSSFRKLVHFVLIYVLSMIRLFFFTCRTFCSFFFVACPLFAYFRNLRAHNELCLQRFRLCLYRRKKWSRIFSVCLTVLSAIVYLFQRTRYNDSLPLTVRLTILSTKYLSAFSNCVSNWLVPISATTMLSSWTSFSCQTRYF